MKLISLFLFLFLAGCTKDNYLAFVYPDKTNLMDFKVIGEYKSLNECLSAANASAGSTGSYECGKNCDRSKSPMVCDETIGNEK